MTIELGDQVREDVTGYEGIVTSRSTFLSGCARLGVQAKMDKDGKIPQVEVFDENRLTVIAKGVIAADKTETSKRPGGDERDMPRNLR